MAGKEPDLSRLLASCQRSGPEAAFPLQEEPLDPAQMFPVGGGAGDFSKRNRARLTISHFLEV